MLNPLPLAVWLLILPIGGVEFVLSMAEAGLVNWPGSAGWREGAVQLLGVTPQLQDWMLGSGQFPPEHVARYLGFGLVHLGPLQAVLVMAIVAGLGTGSAGVLGSARVLGVALAAQGIGAVVFGAVAAPGAWLVGGYPLAFAMAGIYAASTQARRGWQVLGALVLGRVVLAGVMGGMDWLADLAAAGMGYGLARVLRPGLLERARAR
jgi:hypothetical protein